MKRDSFTQIMSKKGKKIAFFFFSRKGGLLPATVLKNKTKNRPSGTKKKNCCKLLLNRRKSTLHPIFVQLASKWAYLDRSEQFSSISYQKLGLNLKFGHLFFGM